MRRVLLKMLGMKTSIVAGNSWEARGRWQEHERSGAISREAAAAEALGEPKVDPRDQLCALFIRASLSFTCVERAAAGGHDTAVRVICISGRVIRVPSWSSTLHRCWLRDPIKKVIFVSVGFHTPNDEMEMGKLPLNPTQLQIHIVNIRHSRCGTIAWLGQTGVQGVI